MSCNAKFGSFVCLQTSLKELKLVWKLTVSTEEWHSELMWDSWRFLESRSVENRRRTHRFFRGRGGKVPARTSIILLLLRSSVSRATSELSRSAEILEILLFALKTQAEAFRKQISVHRWTASLHASQLSSKQPLGSEVCYLVYKVITNKVFKQKIPLPITRMMKPIPSVKAPLTSPAISRAARLLNCSAGAACVRNTEGTEPPLCVGRAENIPWNRRSKPSDSHTHLVWVYTAEIERKLNINMGLTS